ncbi:alpha/beta hydrolase [Bizionia paragorgiae]|jgi:pimeloyl-ACP methyl ester carboxylesterase|uniref:alpha/beta fold hydrolase n=1 Tax=Bizionia paragorgiae TaxID=283786 RepID=UPI00299E1E3C|nr:alpha/beta hydrolase [Bizionia paragorgiae]MDX1272144.1 alpha/beta hydrolase [Bizionia paragorgiae]
MTINYKEASIYFSVEGQGPAVVLLHGFLEDSTMWDDLTPRLSQTHTVVAIDLLGHGKSDALGYIHSMEAMAEAVEAVLSHLNIVNTTFIGHSMGGYVALAFAKLYTNRIQGLCLLNSTFQPDSEERKALRTRANKMAQQNFEAIIKMSFANLFSAESKIQHEKAYKKALSTALKTSLQGYMAANEGMKHREDFSAFFALADFKKLILLGKKDTLLDLDYILNYAKNHGITTSVFSEGHMSHIENKREFLDSIMVFIENT